MIVVTYLKKKKIIAYYDPQFICICLHVSLVCMYVSSLMIILSVVNFALRDD